MCLCINGDLIFSKAENQVIHRCLSHQFYTCPKILFTSSKSTNHSTNHHHHHHQAKIILATKKKPKS
uniref:Uncharacterized protein n=1 Tax=Wuchereria bancrofti TaxID=6293 RepID=A0A1I8EDA5_WUCBA